MAGVGETCSKIADPETYQGRIEDDSLREAKRRWLYEIKTKLRAVPEKSNQEDHSRQCELSLQCQRHGLRHRQLVIDLTLQAEKLVGATLGSYHMTARSATMQLITAHVPLICCSVRPKNFHQIPGYGGYGGYGGFGGFGGYGIITSVCFVL